MNSPAGISLSVRPIEVVIDSRDGAVLIELMRVIGGGDASFAGPASNIADPPETVPLLFESR